MSTTTVQKWGNSLAVRISKDTARKLSLKNGTPVRVSEASGGILHITPIKVKRLSIDEMIAAITPENLNIDYEWVNAKPVGKEIW